MGDEDLAAAIAEFAGNILLDVSSSTLWSGDERGRIADLITNGLVLAALATHRPRDRILSEEGDGGASDKAIRCWIVDPLDGTREFVEGRDDWAVHIGLAVNGRPEVGAVSVPRKKLLLRSDRPPPLPRPDAKARILVSRTRPAAQADRVAELLHGNLIPMGSVGAKIAALLAGEADIYLHSGGQSQWDSCAPVAIAIAAGFDATRLNGEPLVYGSENPELADIVVSHPHITSRLRDALADIGERAPEAVG
ncbi:MAG TPA: 3'(2'),5'-bisphosphate nucleotidase CysQ [Sphingomicrobium sp.]|nr:3'(2'),5'-bisphosphate nucleotidase CysQ [Sphingomicrobium sp.]